MFWRFERILEEVWKNSSYLEFYIYVGEVEEYHLDYFDGKIYCV